MEKCPVVINTDMEKEVRKILRRENWRGFIDGKVTGGLAVLDVLGIEREKRIAVLAEAIGLSSATATEFVNQFYTEKESGIL